MGRVIQSNEMEWTRFDDHRRVRVVGDAYHQPALASVTGGATGDGARYECEAELMREPDNAHDAHAVMVVVKGKRVGYLQKGTARRLGKRLRAFEEARKRHSYTLLIRGDGPYGAQAHLEIAYGSELLNGWKNPKRKRSR